MSELAGPEVNNQPPIDANLVAQAVQHWNAGQQDVAKSLISAAADAGAPVAQLLLAWFLHQQGEPGWREAIPYARAAVEAGYPQAAGYVVGNMMNDPTLREAGISIARLAAAQGAQTIDPVSQLLQFAQTGDVNGISTILATPVPWGAPFTPDGWSRMVSNAQEQAMRVANTERELSQNASALLESWENLRSRVEGQSTQLMSFMTQTTNAEASSHFESEAAASKTEASRLWSSGVAVIAVAAVVSLLPLVAHYFYLAFEVGPQFSEFQILGAHITAAVALATLAGVVLSRSRVRDRNRQRNTDLAVALKMMFSYATQIEDPAERQQFVASNGRVVLEAYLRQDAPPTEDPQTSSVIAALLAR